MTDQELKDLVASLAISQAKTDKELNKINAELTRISAIIVVPQAKTNWQIRESNMNTSGNIDNNVDYDEHIFYTSLAETMQLGAIKFDEIERNMRHKRKNLIDEFNIIMYNDKSIGLIEVRYEAKSYDIKNLFTTKVQNFKILYPEYEGYKIYLGIAGFSFDNDLVKVEAQNMGIAVLEEKGDHIEITAQKLTAF